MNVLTASLKNIIRKNSATKHPALRDPRSVVGFYVNINNNEVRGNKLMWSSAILLKVYSPQHEVEVSRIVEYNNAFVNPEAARQAGKFDEAIKELVNQIEDIVANS